MSGIPEGIETQPGEGRDLKSAIEAAAEALGCPPNRVAYKLDLAHFRSSTGGSRPRETVKIIAWEGPEREEAVAAPPRERRPRRERDEQREDRHESRDEEPSSGRELRGAEEGTTEASEFAQGWFQGLLDLMEVEGTVKGTGSDDRVHLYVTAKKAGRVIGKRGSTLGAIRHMLRLSLESYGSPVIDVDVADNRDGERGGDRDRDRSRGRDRDRGGRDRDRGGRGRDRGGRGGRDRDRGGRDRDRGGRGRDRGGRDRDRGGRGREKGRFPEEKLKTLARKAAAKAKETGRTITINLELNSYDRRLIHVEVAELDGVSTQSQDRDGTKFVQVIPE